MSTETLTFLFTDIEGSTALLKRLGEDVYADVLADHHSLIRSCLATHGGREVSTQGDGFFAVFSSPRACASAVIEMQRGFGAHEWPAGEQLRVRMGVHFGEASENVTGLARMVRSYAIPAMENVALWHERDISHSSVERYIGPDATITLDFALVRMAGVVEKLLVYPERMQENLDSTRGLVHSQRVLLALTQKGVSREDSYSLVQKNAMRAWKGEGMLLDLLKADKDVTKALSNAELESLFDLGYHFKQVDMIFKRVFG